MTQLNEIRSKSLAFPFHHITKIQMQGKFQPTVQEGDLPQLEIHYKTEHKIPALRLPSLTEALQKYLQIPEMFRTRGSIIDILS